MNSRTLRALEFGKVLEHLASFCVSEAGKQVCLQTVPLNTPKEVTAELALFDDARTFFSRSGFRLREFPDLSSFLSVFAHSDDPIRSVSVPDTDAFWAVRDAFGLLKEAIAAIHEESSSGWPHLERLCAETPFPDMSLAALRRCLDDSGMIRDESSPELLFVRSELRRLHTQCLRKVKDFALRYNLTQYLQDDFMTLASDRYVLPLKSNFKGRVQGIIHDYSNTGETCYFEPIFLIELNNRLQDLKKEEREEEYNILRYLQGVLVQEKDRLLASWKLLIRLDAESAKTGFAAFLDATCASVDESENAPLSLLKARHPLLAFDRELQKKGGPHPIDLIFRSEDRALVISGGNAGGKTVCLKTLGLLTIMTLSGLPIPAARGAVVPWWPRIQAFIGDEQSLDDHLSTYTAQIRHLSASWEHTDSRTLVLLDEFGAGTDPTQGAALAQAVLDGLLERGAHIVSATHFPALKNYALSREHVRAASVLFDPGTKKPLFRLAYDQVGASQALDAAREHGLPESVLRRAEQYMLLDGEDSGAVLNRLNELAAQRERDLEKLEEERRRYEEKRRSLQERFEKERLRLQEDLQRQSADIMKKWQEGRIAHRQALKEMARLKAEASPQTEKPQPTISPEQICPGQTVLHRPWNRRAIVQEIDSGKKRVRLDMNGVTMWADISLIELADPSPAPASSGATVRTAQKNPVFLRLDLRGKRVDIALGELSQFLDRALLSGQDGVEILHGRGTGVLRREVHAFLKTFPGLASFATAKEDQGGDGVTIASFR
ncbi:MAG: Smr/MutS family protein [Desulfovibrionaceae bacterium]|nr:Smr/MutS family protein [Desulfovibrionaceae bacterium]